MKEGLFMNVLVVMPFKDKHKELMKQSFPEVNFIYEKNPSEDLVKSAQMIIGNVKTHLLKSAEKLKLLQLNSAGTDGYCNAELMPKNAVLCNATGAYGLAISEYMLATLMAMQKKLYRYHNNQKQNLWQDEGEVTSISGSTIIVIGLGDIGSKFAQKVKALGASRVIGVKRRITAKPDYIDELISLDSLNEYLSQADVVATVLPGTSATYHLFDKTKFGLMKKGAFFVNAGRGSAIVEEDLCQAVESGHLKGASLDVTEVEPLPKESKMWQIENIHITPHTAGQYHLPATHDNIVNIAHENLRRLLAGEEAINQVDFATGYKK